MQQGTGEITFTPDRSAYIRAHAWMAAFAMAAGMGTPWAAGNPHIWTGPIGGLAAHTPGPYNPHTRPNTREE